MRWKQFFTPVLAFNAEAAKKYMDRMPGNTFTLLDVRQVGEYEDAHLPGAKLIPLPDLNDRITELDAAKPTIVYCAIGGRSRVAAQMLAGKGFREVYNLTGGIKAWKSEKAFGQEDLGLNLFSGKESPAETLIVAYCLEAGLREFYQTMASKVKNENACQLFETLSSVELKHQDRIFEEYLAVSGAPVNRAEFTENIVVAAMEGGLTTKEYLQLYKPDLEVPGEILSLAMAIEAQALDLYQRASDRAETESSRKVLMQIAHEERSHLAQLGNLFETFKDSRNPILS